MSAIRSTRNSQTRSSEELESDESYKLEERLKNLLKNADEKIQPQKIFNNVQEVPKLRRSVVARAIHNVVCSTPMPTEKKTNFFYAENSLNISPIDPICEEEVEVDDKQKRDEQNRQEQLKKEAKVILTRALLPPIVISDSEDEEEIQSILKEGENQNINRNTDIKVHDNTRNELITNIEDQKSGNNENTKNTSNKAKNFEARRILRSGSNSKKDNPLTLKQSKVLQESTHPSRHSKQTENDSISRYKSNSNLINKNTDTEQDALSNCDNQDGQYNSKYKNNETGIKDAQNRTGNDLTEQSVRGRMRTRSRNLLATTNISQKDKSNCNNTFKKEKSNCNNTHEKEKSNCNNIFDEEKLNCIEEENKNVSNITQNMAKNLCSNSDIGSTENDVLSEDRSKNKLNTVKSDMHHQKRMPSRKLSFTSTNQDQENKNASVTIQKNEIIPQTAKKSAKLSKIPISRSRSKSKDKNPDSNLKNISVLETRHGKYNKENSRRSRSPPKRPPRRKNATKKLAMTGTIPQINHEPSDNPQSELTEGTGVDNFNKKSEVPEDATMTQPVRVLPADKIDQANFNRSNRKEDSVVSQNKSRLENLVAVLTEKKLNDQVKKKEALALQNDLSLENHNNVRNKSDERIENNINPEKTLVEMGTSPIILLTSKKKNVTTHSTTLRQMVEAGTSTCNFSAERDIIPFVESEKAENLNRTVSDARLQKSNRNTLNNNEDPSEAPPDNRTKQVRVTMTNKEVQTSLERTTFRRNNKDREHSHSKDSSATDHSGVINECEKSCYLYQSLNILDTNFSSSSDEEVFERSCSGPWRGGESLPVFSRNSCKLSFLRRAAEIEKDRLAKALDETEPERIEFSHKNTSGGFAGYAKKRVYSRPSQYTRQSMKLQDTGVDKRPPSSRSEMSDLVITESDSNHSCRADKQPREPSLSVKNSEAATRNKSPSETNDSAIEALVQNNSEAIIAKDNEGHGNEEISSSGREEVNKSSSENDNVGNGNEEISSSRRGEINKSSSGNDDVGNGNEEISSSRREEINKSRSETGKNQNSVPNHVNSFHCTTENVVHNDDEDEILAVPLEDTNAPAMGNTSVRILATHDTVDKIMNNEADHGTTEKELEDVIKSARSTSSGRMLNTSFKKPIKARGKGSNRKKILPEHDDGISSTTVGSEDITGLRRSGRERRVVKRHFIGVIATHSEFDLKKFNTLATSSVPNKITKPRTKKKGKEVKNSTVKKPADKKKRGGRKKVAGDKEPQDSNMQESNKGISDASIESTRPVETNAIVTNEFDKAGDSDAFLRTRKHFRSGVSCSSQDKTSNKRSNTLASDEVYDTNESELLPRKKLYVSDNNFNDSEIVNFNTNTDAGVTEVYANDNERRVTIEENSDRGNTMHDNLHIPEEFTRAIEKDSGRSTMLKSSTFEESNMRTNKPLTGRINKKYKRKEDLCTKISKVLSRSINTSKEQEIVNENGMIVAESFSTANNDEDVRSRRTSIVQYKPKDSEFINLMTNDNLISLRYVEKDIKFKLVKDNLMVSDGLKNLKDGGTMGYLKLPPATQKSMHIARKFALFYFVTDGEGFIQVHNKASTINKYSTFIIPLGVEYAIVNSSKEDPLILAFVKMPSRQG